MDPNIIINMVPSFFPGIFFSVFLFFEWRNFCYDGQEGDFICSLAHELGVGLPIRII